MLKAHSNEAKQKPLSRSNASVLRILEYNYTNNYTGGSTMQYNVLRQKQYSDPCWF